MVFASPVFLFLFLPTTLAAYYIAPVRWRNGVLLVASLVFYAWGEAVYLPLVLASVAFNYAIGSAIGRTEAARARKRWLIFGVVGNLAALAVFKYANFTVANVNTLAPILAMTPVALAAIPLPLGISFFTFHAISYVVDVYKRNASHERNLPRFALYILLFPQLIAGPIIRWRDIAAQLPARAQRIADLSYGVRRFVVGLGKKVIIANTLGQVADQIFALPVAELTTPLAWLGIICYTLQIYFDFSGYSDMAIGLMRMFGFRILENFNYPYIARSIREFWRRWHISLSNWFRDYLYVPLGGNRRGERRAYTNLVIVFLLCGLWHGASWPFVLWGAWHGLFLVAERAGLDRLLARMPWLAHVYTLLVVMGGWVLFRSDTLSQALPFYAALLGQAEGDALRHPLAEYVNGFVAVTLAAGVLFSTPLARSLGRLRDSFAIRSRAAASIALTVDTAWLFAVFFAACAFLAAGTYNPFIYFRF
jgi:alginate O-acetyltransferase complex protein AlgI